MLTENIDTAFYDIRPGNGADLFFQFRSQYATLSYTALSLAA